MYLGETEKGLDLEMIVNQVSDDMAWCREHLTLPNVHFVGRFLLSTTPVHKSRSMINLSNPPIVIDLNQPAERKELKSAIEALPPSSTSPSSLSATTLSLIMAPMAFGYATIANQQKPLEKNQF